MHKDCIREIFFNDCSWPQKYLKRGVTAHGYLKPALIAFATAVNKIMLPIAPSFECDNAQGKIEKLI